ncbi:MAG: hypothetical protein JKY31_07680 [Rhodobacteraceae bacterium]|nr:hypothetical protein [Paracoccaceae bacterium]
MKKLFLAASLILLPVAALADSSCFDIAQAFRAEPELNGLIAGTGPCTDAEFQIFRANQAAINRAQPITDIAELVGTWLSDDVGMVLEGKITPSQDVLVIAPNWDGESVLFTQLIYKSWRPFGSISRNAETGYGALVASGQPESGARSPGKFLMFDPLVYSYTQMEHSREEELFTLARINHFGISFEVMRTGDILVIESQIRDFEQEQLVTHFSTYTRVAPDAPDLAISLVTVLEISQAAHFDCFVHQLSDGGGGLLEAFDPYPINEVQAAIDAAIMAQNAFQGAMAAKRAATGTEGPTNEELRVLAQANADAGMSPVIQHLAAQRASGSYFGCVPLL